MKILLIANAYSKLEVGGTNFGGIEVFLNTFIIESLKYGHEITLIATNDSKDLINNQNFHLFTTLAPSKPVLNQLTGNPKARFPYGQISKIICDLGLSNFDLVINNTDKSSIAGCLYNQSKIHNVKNVVTYLHNLPVFRGSDQMCASFLKTKDYITYIANSKHTFDSWNKVAKTITKDENEFLCSSYNNLRVKDTTTDRNLLEKGINGLVSVGRLHKDKNPGLTKTISLTNELKHLPIYYFGISDLDDSFSNNFLKQPNGENYFYMDRTPVDEKFSIIEDNGLVTFSPSLIESFGMTAVESLSKGYPFIVPDFPYNNIKNFVLESIQNGYENFSDDPNIIITKIGAIIPRSNIHKSIEYCLHKWRYEDFYDPEEIVKYFKKYFAFNNEFIEKLTIK